MIPSALIFVLHRVKENSEDEKKAITSQNKNKPG